MYACEQTPRLTVHQESVSENSNTTHPLPSQRAEHEQATLPGLVPGALQQGSAAGRVTGTLVGQYPPLLDSLTLYDPVTPPLAAHMVKNLPAMQDIWVRSLGQEDPLKKKQQPTPVFLPGESHRQRSLVSYSS